MAKHQITTITSDLSGADDAHTVRFGLDGKNYELDLTEREHLELRAILKKYVDAGTAVSNTASAPTARRKYGTGPARKDTKDIRAWIRANGGEISDRGRIPKVVEEAFETKKPLATWKKAAPESRTAAAAVSAPQKVDPAVMEAVVAAPAKKAAAKKAVPAAKEKANA